MVRTISIDSSVAPGTFLAAVERQFYFALSRDNDDPGLTYPPTAVGRHASKSPCSGRALSFTTVGAGNIQGQLNGSIRHADFMALVPPFLAQSFTSQIQSDPTSNTAIQIKQIFDTGCTAGDGFQNDDVIELCEVTGSSLIQAVLAPDVQIRDADGNYAPNPLNTTRDANSFGVAFTAIVTDRVFANGFDH
jgi:hypothetical protein